MIRKSSIIVVVLLSIAALCTAAVWAANNKTPIKSSTSAASFARQTSPIVLGYYADASPEAFTKYHNYMNQVSTDTLNTDAEGNLVGTTPKQAVQQARNWKMGTFALVSNYGETDWDSDAAHQAITDPTARKKLIASLLQTVKQNHYTGVNLDFESLVPEDRGALSAFVRDTAKIMKNNGFQIMVSVPAKQQDDPEDGWSGAYDYAAIGKVVDWLQVMTYDEHGTWSEPGSSASLGWTEASLAFAVKQVPARKILMGLPAYGNDWNVKQTAAGDDSDNAMLPWNETKSLLTKYQTTSKRDQTSGSMIAQYTDSNGDPHEVWYEDAISIKHKTKLVQAYKLAGVSMYAIGMEDESFWKAVQAGLHK
ncbi:glycosyl hydrolase family 18 protein [Paenibacillus sp. WLX1005]|uniref:glycosyl hydrolase family 18 protein n=1 Tax=Paenibacillus sp. WLX1005 TaxID=3243766 RepID=UPI0039843613